MRPANLRWLPIALLFFGATLAALPEAPAGSEESQSSGRIYVATYDGVINPVAAEYFAQAISDATAGQAEAIVIKLDTPGGLDTSMRLIIKAITAAEIPVIVYVAPS